MDQNDQVEFLTQTKRNYDRMSRFYDLLSGGTEKRVIEKTISAFEVGNPARILEIGIGTGNGLFALRAGYPAAGIFGFDLSFGMCRKAASKVRNSTHERNTAVIQADGLLLPLPPHFADLVFLSFTLELFPGHLMHALLVEIQRVLKPSGFCAAITMFDDDRSSFMSRLYRAAHARMPHVVDCRPIDTPAVFRQSGFIVKGHRTFNIWGLPVIAVLAQAPG